ncbi:Bgt-4277 [Blumeria graminis f. sp. tritici]|uniref:Bgt-4277 n=3 Tax=Blumeria graminis TaxID=34373 RepID=A0A061HH74_BLUGR|nr:hypothetical protein BGT96224_4277 [Blumeria graminis f. sp. tritici 96224]VDB83619.1 Bgt-4277 [Blumeria graminis f. sp. tritici]
MPSLSASSVYGMGITSANLQLQPQRNQSNSNLPTPAQSSSRSSHISIGQYSSSPNSTMLSQFSTPQSNSQNLPAATSGQAISSATPQTPNFPPYNTQTGPTMISPLSLDPEACEKERVKILLKINKELLLEVIRLQSIHNEAKEEVTNISTNLELSDKEKTKGPASSRYYFECMRRLQANLAYLAARTDRSKSSNQLPTHPQIMSAPTLTSSNNPPVQGLNPSHTPETKRENEDTEADVDRLETLKEYYKSLQALFPSVDPRKDSLPNTTGRVQPQKQAILDQNVQQKMQNEMLRQKMIQAQQAPQNHKQMSHSQQQQR